jgi:membrane associated rhomboid family serine protease
MYRSASYWIGEPPSMFRNPTPVVRALLIANVIVYLLETLTGMGDTLLWNFALWPLGAQHAGGAPFEPWQLITYGFLHDPSNYWHIISNMFGLLVFAPELELGLGARRFTLYYLVCVVGAGLSQLLVMHWSGGAPVPTIGASGGIFGLLLLFAIAFPHRKVLVYFAIPMPVWLFVTLYGVAELAFGVFGRGQSIAHFAHLGGLVSGFALISYWRWRGRMGRPPPTA